MSDPPNETTKNELNKIRNSLKEIGDCKLKGAIIRSRVKWIEEGEKSSKYFYNLEKNNFVKKYWKIKNKSKINYYKPRKIKDISERIL